MCNWLVMYDDLGQSRPSVTHRLKMFFNRLFILSPSVIINYEKRFIASPDEGSKTINPRKRKTYHKMRGILKDDPKGARKKKKDGKNERTKKREPEG